MKFKLQKRLLGINKFLGVGFLALSVISFCKYYLNTSIVYDIENCVNTFNQIYVSYLDVVLFSHVSIAAVSLSLGFYVLFKDSKNLKSRLLFSITLCISVWLLLDQITWSFGYNAKLTMFVWSLLSYMTVAFFLLNIYFYYVVLEGKDLPLKIKLILYLLAIPALFLTPTRFNLSGWDAIACEASEGFLLTYYAYLVGFIVAVWILFIAIQRYSVTRKNDTLTLLYLTIGCELSVITFDVSNLLGSWTQNWHVSQYGLLGVPIFIGLLSYLITKHKIFDFKLVAAQALVNSIVILGATQVIFVQNRTNIVLKIIITGLFGFLGTWLIVTIRNEVRQKERAHKLNSKLQQLDQAKDDFINIASHQLKSPVAIIQNSIEMAEMQKTYDPDFFETSRKQIRKLNKIVSEILLASKLTTKKYSAEHREDVHIEELVKAIISEQVQLYLPKSTPALTLHLPKGFTLHCDQLYFTEAVTNIVSNAIKYSSNKGEAAKVEIELSFDVQSRHFILRCRDNGIGMSEEDLGKVFHKFERAKNAQSTASGSGLGMFITKEIVEGHGGKIEIKSELNKGTEVRVTIPVPE